MKPSTSAGPIDVATTEPFPGLHVYKVPANVSPNSKYPWILAHHEGYALASFESSDAAVAAAGALAPLADWTRSVMTAANQVSFGGNARRLLELLADHGGQHPNA